jgi:hypothetical protein
MQELNKKQFSTLNQVGSSCAAQKRTENEIISIEECRNYFNGSNMTDKAMKAIRNNLIGVVDSLINTYLEDFR